MFRGFDIRPVDQPMIAAGIALGDWLSCLPEVTPQQCEIIRGLQAALRRLPSVTRGLEAEYGFEGVDQTEHGPTARCWSIGMYHSGSILEIGSNYTPDQRLTSPEEARFELLGCRWEIGKRFKRTTFNYDRWIQEVAAAEDFRRRCSNFAVEVVTRTQSSP